MRYGTKENQQKMSPSEILELFKAGNERFASGNVDMRDFLKHVGETADGQYPLAVVLACMDSRISTEAIFDMGIGDLFSIRIAGNVVGFRELGSMEYGCAIAGASLLVVLGHTRCGAVTAAVDLHEKRNTAVDATGCANLDSITDEIVDAIRDESDTDYNRSASNQEFVDSVAEQNVRHSMQRIHDSSSKLRALIDDGAVMLVGGMYDVATGRVRFLD